MAEEISFVNETAYNFKGFVTLTLDQVILPTVVHHSSTSTYMPNFIEIKETFCGWTNVRTFETHLLGRLTRVDLKYDGPYGVHHAAASSHKFPGAPRCSTLLWYTMAVNCKSGGRCLICTPALFYSGESNIGNRTTARVDGSMPTPTWHTWY